MLSLNEKIPTIILIVCFVGMILPLDGCRKNTGAVLPERVTAQAAANALKYANARYEYGGKTFCGVPYLWGAMTI